MSTFFFLMGSTMRLVFLLTTVLSLLIPNSVQAQTNLVANPGFESEGLSWSIRLLGDVNLDGTVSFLDISPFIAVLSAGDYQFEADVNRDGSVDFLDISPFIALLQNGGGTFPIASNETVDGDRAAVLVHGTNPVSSGFSQLVSAPLIGGRSYIFSANVFFENGGGQATLVARAQGAMNDLVSQAFPATPQVWEKVQVRFTVPANAPANTRVRLFLRSEESTGSTYFDAIKLFEVDGASNLIANQDFEINSNWNLRSGASYSNAEQRFGNRSLRLDSSNSSYAAQNVSLGPEDTDQPIYTLSAHIKTTGVVPAPITGVDWGSDQEVGNTFNTVPGRGAAFKVDLFDGSTLIRTIYSPYFFSKATVFTEREFSFLPPEGITSFNVTALVSGGNFQAYFDNVQLRAWEVPDGAGFVDNVGVAEVEAPEAETYVAATPSSGIQGIVDSVTTPSNSNYGKLVWAGRGNYSQPNILLRSTTHLKLHKDATLIKSEDTGNSMWFGASVKSGGAHDLNVAEAHGVAISDVIVEGGTVNNNNGEEDFAGSAVAIFGDRVIVRNVNIPGYSRTPDDFRGQYSASAILMMGHHTYVYNNFISGPKAILGHDGIHLWGGTHSHIMSNEVLAGDDGLGLFTGTNDTFDADGDPPIACFNRNISDVEVYNNKFDSVGARCVGLGLAVPRDDVTMTNTVSRIRIRNFTGLCGGIHPQLIVICVPGSEQPVDIDAPEQIRDVLLQNAFLEGYRFPQPGIEDPLHPGYCGGSLQEQPRLPPYGMRVFTDDVGSVRNVRFENISTRNFEDIVSANLNRFSAVVDVFKNGNSALQRPNANITFRSCTLGQDADLGNDAIFAFRIDGDSTEVSRLEDPSFENVINSLGFQSYLDGQ